MFSFRQHGKRHFGMVGQGTWLPLGDEKPYQSFYGLQKLGNADLAYRHADWTAEIGPWAPVLSVTAYPESLSRFDAVNTYDSAGFTFGFLQQAAHTADDNLVLFYRRLVPAYPDWFGDLRLHNGTIHKVGAGGALVNLEIKKAFRDHLNPAMKTIDEIERTNVLKLVHLTTFEPATRRLQVLAGVDGMKRKVRYYRDVIPEVTTDRLLSLLLSVFHWRGGGLNSDLKKALASPNPEAEIIALIKKHDAGRSQKTELEWKRLIAAGALGSRTFRKADGTWT